MTELERFWHWYDNERPGLRAGAPMLHKNVSREGRQSLNLAIAEVSRVTGLRNRDEDWAPIMTVVRDLSLAFERGLLRADEQLVALGYIPGADDEDW